MDEPILGGQRQFEIETLKNIKTRLNILYGLILLYFIAFIPLYVVGPWAFDESMRNNALTIISDYMPSFGLFSSTSDSDITYVSCTDVNFVLGESKFTKRSSPRYRCPIF